MFKVQVRVTLLALLLPLLLNATNILKDDILKPEAVKLIDTMANELVSKTGLNAYLVATNENFPEKFNLVQYSRQYEVNMSKPFVILIFAPNAIITKKSEQTGRVAILSSSKDVSEMFDKGDVEDATIDVIAAKDKNTKEDKFNIGLVQGFSELADQVAKYKNVEMTSTIPNDTRVVIKILKFIVMTGAVLVFWMFIFRPIYMRIKNGKREN